MEERIMKKCFSNIRTLAALLMAGAFAACSSDDNSIEQPANPTAPKTYTLTVNASKGDASTRALALDGTKLLAKWADGDELYVYKATNRAECISDNKLGTISVVAGSISADGKSATFTGNLSGTVTVETGNKLMLVYHPVAFAIAGFEGQAGTLASASNLDCATASVTASVSGSDITIAETSATFTTHTAMLKLTLTTDGTTTINPTSLKMSMSLGTTTLKEFTFTPTDATYTANGNGVLYFALPSVEDVAAGLSTPPITITTTQLAGVTITYAATVGDDTYIATKTNGYTFAAGKYYAGTLTMAKLTDLSTISGTEYTVQDGEVLTGTLASNVKISIAAPVAPATTTTVTLKDANINGENDNSYKWAGITCEGDATIILEGTNTVKGFYHGYPGIFVSSGKTLVIKGTGELNASSNGSYDAGLGGAGIGGGNGMNCGDIEIQSGTVTATGNKNGAGIGGGYNADCGNITISGGTVTATGGEYAAGIGGGKRFNVTGSCGNITISGGTITATGGEAAAGIGGGRGNNNSQKSSCGTIEITSGVTSVTATKGSGTDNNSIGAGSFGTCGAVTIAAGANVTATVTATGHALSASAVGEIVGSDGKAYAVADKNYMPSGVTAAGLVAYKNGDNGLAIALTDEPNTMDWDVVEEYADV